MGMSAGNRPAQINVTPMIDVLLVLMIIFMVMTPLTPTGLKTLIPQPAPSVEPPQPVSRDIVISVRNDRTVRLNQESVPVANLQACLTGLFKSGANRVAFVRGDKDLDFRQIAEVIDIARGAGLDRIALMTE